MVAQHLTRIAFYLTLYTICALLNVGCAVPDKTVTQDGKYFSTWELEYSGKYKLIWYYKTRTDFGNNQPNKVLVGDKEFVMRSDVRPPTINGLYLLEYSHVNEGETVLDIGTGSGVHAIFAAEKASRVVATDIFPPAIENAKTNAQLHGAEDKIDFRVGDLFEPVNDSEKFDVFFININFPSAVGDDRHKLHERFFAEVQKYMKPNARIYYQTSFVKNIPYILEMLSRNNLRIMEMHMNYFPKFKHEALFIMVKSQ